MSKRNKTSVKTLLYLKKYSRNMSKPSVYEKTEPSPSFPGGYDRTECLRSVEQYVPETNTWRPLPPMRESRGRFKVAVLDDRVYAIGGSNGTTELDSVEMLDTEAGKWVKTPRLPLARSNMGVCTLDGLIYCIGGWNGQVGIKQCDVFDPKTGEWSSIAPLHTGEWDCLFFCLRGWFFLGFCGVS